MGSIQPYDSVPAGSWSLENKVVLITGAGRGLGAGMARELSSRGATVCINYARSAKPALALVEEIESQGGRACAIQADVSKVPEVTRMFEEAIAHFGKIDIVVNNSGMESFAKEEEVTEEMYDAVFGLNTRAQFFVGQHALKHLSRMYLHDLESLLDNLTSADLAMQMVAVLSSCRQSLPP